MKFRNRKYVMKDCINETKEHFWNTNKHLETS